MCPLSELCLYWKNCVLLNVTIPFMTPTSYQWLSVTECSQNRFDGVRRRWMEASKAEGKASKAGRPSPPLRIVRRGGWHKRFPQTLPDGLLNSQTRPSSQSLPSALSPTFRWIPPPSLISESTISQHRASSLKQFILRCELHRNIYNFK